MLHVVCNERAANRPTEILCELSCKLYFLYDHFTVTIWPFPELFAFLS